MVLQAPISNPIIPAQTAQQSLSYAGFVPSLQPWERAERTGNPFVDVDPLTKLHITSNANNSASTGHDIAKVPQHQLQTQVVPPDNCSSTDASSASKQSIFEPSHENRIETPRTSCERAESEDGDELGLLHTVVRAESTPKALVFSTPKHSKLMPAASPRKVSVSDSPASLRSSPGRKIKPSRSSSFIKSEDQRRPSDLNKPLPPPPELVNLDEPEEHIVFKEKIFGGSSDHKRILSSPIKTSPNRPSGRRSSSLKSNFDRPVSELYKSLRSPKPSDELFKNLSPDLGLGLTQKPPPIPPSRRSSNSSIAKPISSFSTVHIVDQYSSSRDQHLSGTDNPFDSSPLHQELTASPFQQSTSPTTSSSSVKDGPLQSSPTSTANVCSPPTPFSTLSSAPTSPSTRTASKMCNYEAGASENVTLSPTPDATVRIAKPSEVHAGREIKPPPPLPPPRRSSSKNDSGFEVRSMLNQVDKSSTNPPPQVPRHCKSLQKEQTHQPASVTSTRPASPENTQSQLSNAELDSLSTPDVSSVISNSTKHVAPSQDSVLTTSFRSTSPAVGNGDTILADMMALQKEVDALRDRCAQAQAQTQTPVNAQAQA